MRLKQDKKAGNETKYLEGKNIVLLFAKDSTRTRCSFEVGAFDQGARVTYIGSSGSQMGSKESIKDTARVLGRMYDGIEYRGFEQEIVETLAQYSGVPVWNGLTNEAHPTQFLADLLTIIEHKPADKPLEKLKVCFVGTADNNVANSLMVGCAKMGIEYAAVGSSTYAPDTRLVAELRAELGAKISVTENIEDGVRGADFIYTDVWVSMGEPKTVWEERIKLLTPYRIDSKMMALTGNPACKFLHCLPAFHDLETEVGRDIHSQFGLTEMEVSDEVFESPASVVFDQAENRMHTIKAVMVATLTPTSILK
jgi:ornithine carbamoyltransferase